MPCWELFERQPEAVRDGVLPAHVLARVSVEQASVFGWERYVGLVGASIGMRNFGASAPLQELQQQFGFTVENVMDAARQQLARARKA
jgi:transketolase